MPQTSYFANACGFVIENGNFSTVHGNQINHNNQRIYYNSRKRKRTEYDDYNQVISGNILRTKDFGAYQWDSKDWWWKKMQGHLRANKTICAAEVMGMEGKTFTVVAYSGPDAREEFERDFRKYSGQLIASSFQVYGVNADVPLVLFHNELRPLASFVDSLGLWGRFYLMSWVEHHLDRHCGYHEVWMDSSKGILCRGLPGPECRPISSYSFYSENIPSDIKLLQDDICFRFLASLKSKNVDHIVVRVISEDAVKREDGGRDIHQPTVFSISTNATIAVGTVEWRIMGGFEDREMMENGDSRLTLGCEEGSTNIFKLYHDAGDEVWLSQASSVFHALGISLDSDLSDYQLRVPSFTLYGHLSYSQEARRRRRQQPIYLFVHPPDLSTPTYDCTTSSLHHWSFDLSGQPPLSTTTCDLLGLPLQLGLHVYPPSRTSLTNTTYKRIHDYQIARGFDPTTLDFARSLGYPIFQVQHDSHRFEEVADIATAASLTAFSDVTLPKEVTSKPSTIDSNPIHSTPIFPDPTLEASYAAFASGSNTIFSESTSNPWLGNWSSGYSQRNTQPPPLPHGVSPLFNDQPLHAADASAFAYTTPIHSHASHAGFDFPFGATHPNDYTGWNPNFLWSGLPSGEYLPPPPPVSSLGPPAASSLPSPSYPNASEEPSGWNTTGTPSLKRKEHDISHFERAVGGSAKHIPGKSDTTSCSWTAQKAKYSASFKMSEDAATTASSTQTSPAVRTSLTLKRNPSTFARPSSPTRSTMTLRRGNESRPTSSSMSGNRKSSDREAIKDERDITVKPAAPHAMRPGGALAPKERACRGVSQGTVPFRHSPPATNSVSPKSRSSPRPGGSAPTPKAAQLSSMRKGVAREDGVQSGSAFKKVVSVPPRAPVRTQCPPPPPPPSKTRPTPKASAIPLRGPTKTTQPYSKANASTSVSRTTQPRSKPGPAPKAGIPASQPPSNNGIDGDAGQDRRTHKATKVPSSGVQQRPPPAISTPTKPTKNHERSSASCKRIWR